MFMSSPSTGAVWFKKVYEHHLRISSVIPVTVCVDLFREERNV